jgi:hypothetical protein
MAAVIQRLDWGQRIFFQDGMLTIVLTTLTTSKAV